MADVKSFRFLGPGTLHISRPDGLRVIPPYIPGEIERACIVSDPVNLESLGQPRIASLFAEGRAEPVKMTQEIMAFLKADDPNSLTLADARASEAELQSTYTFDSAVQKQTEELAKNMSPAEKEAAAFELRKMGMGATAKIATLGPDRPAFTPAGPDKA